MAGIGENYVVGNNFDKNIDCVVGGSQSAVASLANQSDMARGGVNYLRAKDSTRILLAVFGITLHLFIGIAKSEKVFFVGRKFDDEDSMIPMK